VTPLSDSTGDANERFSAPQFFTPGRVNTDGSFTVKGLQAGGVSFDISRSDPRLRIKRIERDGVEIKDAIEVRPGERVTGVRIVVHLAQGRISGQVRIAGGALPDGWGLYANVSRPASADESKSGARRPVLVEKRSEYAFVDEKGRFVIDGLTAGEYDLFISIVKRTAGGGNQMVPGPKQRVTVRDDVETSVTLDLDMSSINRPNSRPNNQEDRR
jgi:hypothetical protein